MRNTMAFADWCLRHGMTEAEYWEAKRRGAETAREKRSQAARFQGRDSRGRFVVADALSMEVLL